MIIDLKKEVRESREFHLLEAFLGTLVGQRCLKVELSYGGELMLHVGEPLPYSHPKLADEQKGGWILGSRASGWSFLLNDPPFLIESDGQGPGTVEGSAAHALDPGQVEEKVAQLIGSTIIAATLALQPLRRAPHLGVSVFIGFANRSRLVIAPNDELDEEPHLADWELFTPYGMYLRCGPGPVWSYLRSDVLEAPIDRGATSTA